VPDPSPNPNRSPNPSPNPEQVRDALAYLQLLVSDDPLALGRVINVPPRKIGKATLLSLEHAANASAVSMWQALTLTLTP
jgi:superfamily I DNA/RNA helicase